MTENCENCALRMDVEILDFSNGGCRHEKMDKDFICLAFQDEHIAYLMHGADRTEKCECWRPKKGDENGPANN